jgi:hypothetical protein
VSRPLTVRLTVLLAVPVAVSTVLVLSACESEEGADARPTPTSEETTAADCDRVIPAATVTTLGWSNGAGATYSLRGCERRADQGYLKVRELSVPGGGGDADAVHEEFDARCAELDTFPDPSSTTEAPATGMLVTWLGEGVTACAVEPDGGLGLSKVLLVTPSARLVELWVAAFEPTEQDRVRGAMAALVEAASPSV